MSWFFTRRNWLIVFSILILGIGVSLQAYATSVVSSPPSIGFHHNMALHWFAKTEEPLQVNADGSVPIAEFRRLLRSTATYAVSISQKDQDVDQVVIIGAVTIFVEHAYETGLIVKSKGFGESVKMNEGRLFESQVTYLVATRAISRRLARELNRIQMFAEQATDGNMVEKFMHRRIGKGQWSKRDSAFIEIFVDVYKSSSDYWGDLDNADVYAGVPPWVIAMADAIGAVSGAAVGLATGGPVGAGIGGVVFGATSSAIASTLTHIPVEEEEESEEEDDEEEERQ